MRTGLFNRFARVTLARKDEPGIVDIASPNFGFSVDALRVHFHVSKSIYGAPAKLDLKLYNLSVGTRRSLRPTDGLIILEAGYLGFSNVNPASATADALLPHTLAGERAIIFKGNARSVDHIRQGADWITHVQAGDGEVAYQFGFISLTFAAGTPFEDVASALASAVVLADENGGVDASKFQADLKNKKITGFTPAFAGGYTVYGNAFRELHNLMGSSGYRLSIQNGELVALREQSGNPVETTEGVVVLSSSTGMIGSPEHSHPRAPGVPTLLKARSLLQPRWRPGDRLRLEARSLQGDYRIEKVTHSGDTHGNDWHSEVEARPVTS